MRHPGHLGIVLENEDEEDENRDEEDNCPSCRELGIGSKLGRKIIYLKDTRKGPKISKNPVKDLRLNSEKEYRQCYNCGDIYDLSDLPTANANRVELVDPDSVSDSEEPEDKPKSVGKNRPSVRTQTVGRHKGKLRQIQRKKIIITKKNS